MDEMVSANVTPLAEAVPPFVIVNWIVSNSPTETREGDAVPVNFKSGSGAPKAGAARNQKTNKTMKNRLLAEKATPLVEIGIRAIISRSGL